MSKEKNISLQLYKYLCQKIGSKKEVKFRRLTYIINDMALIGFKDIHHITSGSKGEGLDIKGSDLDIMQIDTLFKVYESERDVVFSSRGIHLVMDTNSTLPCFTQLCLFRDLNLHSFPELCMKNTFLGNRFSSALYKLHHYTRHNSITFRMTGISTKIHGPCISPESETHDLAFCLKCDTWVSQAQPWITRPRNTWPSHDIVSKIVSCGVLFVPIGSRGSITENLEWRLSFSIAEKALIFSFSHTQLLCYALIKIFLKEILEKHEDLKGVLCSYFLKTLMFWISEESDPSMWRPDNTIQCLMVCLKRLVYCVEYSTLLHYFIPDNNLFYLRFNVDQQTKITNILKSSYNQGIYCFIQSETLCDFFRLRLFCIISPLSNLVKSIHETMSVTDLYDHYPVKLIYNLLHYSNTGISRTIFIELLSHVQFGFFVHLSEMQVSQHQPRVNNKQIYYKFKHDIRQMLSGIHFDAISGWLMLASFLYFHKHYLASLSVIDYALSKCTDDKIYPWQACLNQNQEVLINLMKQEKLSTITKTMTIKHLTFVKLNNIFPQELQLNFYEQCIPFLPVAFAHFLRFLCFYHLHDRASCYMPSIHLHQTVYKYLKNSINTPNQEKTLLSLICLGKVFLMMDEPNFGRPLAKPNARQTFLQATMFDILNLTSAAKRLSELT